MRFTVIFLALLFVVGCASAEKKEWPANNALTFIERTIFAYAIVEDKEDYVAEVRAGEDHVTWVH